MVRLIGVGDNTVDTYLHTRMRYPGGNALNVAVLAGRYGRSTAYLGWVGGDARGELILSSLQAEGVDVSHCRVISGGETSYSTVTLVDGDRVFGASAHGVSSLITLDEADLAYIAGFDLVHTSVYSHLEQQIAALKRASRKLSFDFSQRLDDEYLQQILPHVNIAFFSLAEAAPQDMERLMQKAAAAGVELTVMTRGKDGAWAYAGGQLYHQGIIPVENVIDTLGAGDAFAARLLVEYGDGAAIPAAMEAAARSAADNCTVYGAFGYGQAY